MRRLALLAFAVATLAVDAAPANTTPNEGALRAQGAAEVELPAAVLEGMFDGQFLYVDGREPGRFTISLRRDGPGRWTGTARDDGGPQSKVVAKFDGLVFTMSKQYPPDRPEGYAEWVMYVGTIKHDPASGHTRIVGVWSIPGSAPDWGFFEVVLWE